MREITQSDQVVAGVPITPEARQALGTLLREARERAGLTRAQLAAQLEISAQTVGQVELGRRSPRHSTLMRYLRLLPGLTAEAILLRPVAPPVAQETPWTFFRDTFGFVIASVSKRVTLHPGWKRKNAVEYRARGVRPLRPSKVHASFSSLDELAIRESLMRAVFQGGPATLLKVRAGTMDLSRGSVTFGASGKHEFTFPRKLKRGFDYRGDVRQKAYESSVVVDSAIERLELAVGPCEEDALRPMLRAWPAAIPDDEPDIARHLYPAGVKITTTRDGWASVTIEKPLPGLRYSLRWEDVPAIERPTRGSWALGKTLRSARSRAGLTTRELASRACISPATASDVECGADARHSTLMACGQALPHVLAGELLPATPVGPEPTNEGVFEFYRDVFGFEAREVTKTVTVSADESHVTEIATSGLRCLRGDIQDLRVQVGLHRAVAQLTPGNLREIETACSEARVRNVDVREGPAVHQLRFPGRLAQHGINYTRTYDTKSGVYHLSEQTALADLGGEGPVVEGVSIPVKYPVQVLRLCVRIPAAFRFGRPRCYRHAQCVAPTDQVVDLTEATLLPHWRIETGDEWTILSAKIQKPNVGVSYFLDWLLT